MRGLLASMYDVKVGMLGVGLNAWLDMGSWLDMDSWSLGVKGRTSGIVFMNSSFFFGF